MKKRSGFVSNSSTSSFIVLGVKTEDDNKYEEAMKLKIGALCDDSSYYIGEVVSDSDECLENQSFNIQQTLQRVIVELKQLGFDEKDIQLHVGTRSC